MQSNQELQEQKKEALFTPLMVLPSTPLTPMTPLFPFVFTEEMVNTPAPPPLTPLYSTIPGTSLFLPFSPLTTPPMLTPFPTTLPSPLTPLPIPPTSKKLPNTKKKRKNTAETDKSKSNSKRTKSLKPKVRSDTGVPLELGEELPEGVKEIYLQSYLEKISRKKSKVRSDTGKSLEPGEELPEGVKEISLQSFLRKKSRQSFKVRSDTGNPRQPGEELPEGVKEICLHSFLVRKKRQAKKKERSPSDTGKSCNPGEKLPNRVKKNTSTRAKKREQGKQNSAIQFVSPAKKQKKKNQLDENAVQEKLEKYKISNTEYDAYKASLFEKGYNEEQCNRLILRRFSKSSINALLQYHDALIEKGFSHDNLIKISSHTRNKNLAAILPHFQWEEKKCPENRKLSLENLVYILEYGSCKNLYAYQDYIEWEKTAKIPANRNLSLKDLVKILRQSGGYKSLKTFQDYIKWEKTAKIPENWQLSLDDLVEFLNKRGGSENLALVKCYIEKVRENKIEEKKIFNSSQLKRITARHGGSQRLNIVIKHFDYFMRQDISTEDLTHLLTSSSSRETLNARINHEANPELASILHAMDMNKKTRSKEAPVVVPEADDDISLQISDSNIEEWCEHMLKKLDEHDLQSASLPLPALLPTPIPTVTSPSYLLTHSIFSRPSPKASLQEDKEMIDYSQRAELG